MKLKEEHMKAVVTFFNHESERYKACVAFRSTHPEEGRGGKIYKDIGRRVYMNHYRTLCRPDFKWGEGWKSKLVNFEF